MALTAWESEQIKKHGAPLSYWKNLDGTVFVVGQGLVESMLGAEAKQISQQDFYNTLKTHGQKIIDEQGITDTKTKELLLTKPVNAFNDSEKKVYMKALGQNPDESGTVNVYSLPQNTGLDLESEAAQNVVQYGTDKTKTNQDMSIQGDAGVTTGQKATLTSPDGKYKVIVNVGSNEASQLQSKGWNLGDKGKKVVNLTTALNTAGVQPVKEGDVRTSPQTGQQETYTPDGTWQPVAPTTTETTPTAPIAPKTETTTKEPISPTPKTEPIQKQKWVNDLYQKYFDRDATDAEMANWSKESPMSLESFMQSEAKKYGYTSKFFQDTYKSDTDAAIKEFKERGVNAGWPQELIDLGIMAIEGFPKDQKVSLDEIINTFNTIKTNTIDPYFKELADIAIKDFTTAKQSLETNRALELEQERAVAGQDIRQAKEGLEKAGMTFTGKAIETIGKESAYPQATGTPTPTQTPFGGLFYEGTVPQASRLISTSNLARYQANIQELGRTAETKLGTAGAAGLGIGYAPAGVAQTSVFGAAKQQKLAATLQDLIEQQKAKTVLTTTNLNKY